MNNTLTILPQSEDDLLPFVQEAFTIFFNSGFFMMVTFVNVSLEFVLYCYVTISDGMDKTYHHLKQLYQCRTIIS